MKLKILLLIALIGITLGNLFAQGEVTEEQVAYETQLIEANRAKLLGDEEEAITILRKLHREQSTNAAVAYELGRLVLAQGDTEEAIRLLKLARENAPDNTWYLSFLGDLLDEEGRYQEAASVYQQTTERPNSDAQTFYRLAYFQLKSSDPGAALETYDALQARVGLTEAIAQNKHLIYLANGNKRQALRILEELIATQPLNTNFYHLLADYHKNQGQRKEAVAVYEQILRINPKDARATLALSSNGVAERDDLNFLRELQPTFERSDVEIDLKIRQLVPVLRQVVETGDVAVADAAVQLTDLMEQAHPDDPKSFSIAGDLYYHSGRPKEAVAKYREALDQEENIFPVWELLLKSLHETGDAKGLYDTANDALDVFPNRAIVQYYFALGADQLGRYDDALDATSLGSMMSGRDPVLKASLKALEGQVLAHDKDTKGAEVALNEALGLADQLPDVQLRYATFLREQSKLGEAKTAITKALALGATDPYVLVEAAQIAYAEEQYEGAADFLQQAQQRGAQYWPTALELAGDAAFQLNDVDSAVKYWQQAKDLGGNAERLTTKITNRSL